MPELRIETYTMPAAALGPENPLPPLHAYRSVPATVATDLARPAEATDYPDRGNEGSILPYRLQDNYDRVKRPRAFKAIVLENDVLRATFLPEVGGRLWSLYHKPAGRELLHVNPVFQPGNLAVRDAWFSGGVEWNLSIIGHCPLTCSPLFAERRTGADGAPFLRLSEFERIRAVPFQIDFFLPDGSPFLFVRPCILNPNDHAIAMYWWSNIAVDEVEGMRVLGPATSAYFHDYDGGIKSHGLPLRDGRDVTYPTRRASAADLYFRIPDGQRPWVTALDPQGRGLIHTSTRRLIGRKTFLWGTDPGGRRWQEFLAAPGHSYIEIQGGLARTQHEYVAMPSRAQWEWLEAYGLLEADAGVVHGPNWDAALGHVDARLESMLPRLDMEAMFRRDRGEALRPENLNPGSGWGALESRRREKAGVGPLAPTDLDFVGESMGPEQEPWLRLLEDGAMPYRDPLEPPGAYMTQPEWRDLLEQAVAAGRGVHWLSLLHLGVMRYRAGDRAGAGEAWERSLALEPSAWALRNLAMLAEDEGDVARSVERWTAAVRMKPDLTPLAIEACDALLRAGRYANVRQLIDSLPTRVAGVGRIRLIGATAALRCGDLSAAEALFTRGCEIANIREGELSLSDLWFEWHEARLARELGVPIDDALRRRVRRECPVPREFDFRMRPDAG